MDTQVAELNEMEREGIVEGGIENNNEFHANGEGEYFGGRSDTLTSPNSLYPPSLPIPVVFEPESLRQRILQHVDFLFSPQNLSADLAIVGQLDKDMSLPLAALTTHLAPAIGPEMQFVDLEFLLAALQSSRIVTVDRDTMTVRVNPVLPRTTVILRDLPLETPPEEISKLFDESECGKIVSIRGEVGNSWFVAFENEENALKALEHVRSKTLNGIPIKARLKSETLLRTSYYVSETSSMYPPMGPPVDPAYYYSGNGSQLLGYPPPLPPGGWIPPSQFHTEWNPDYYLPRHTERRPFKGRRKEFNINNTNPSANPSTGTNGTTPNTSGNNRKYQNNSSKSSASNNADASASYSNPNHPSSSYNYSTQNPVPGYDANYANQASQPPANYSSPDANGAYSGSSSNRDYDGKRRSRRQSEKKNVVTKGSSSSPIISQPPPQLNTLSQFPPLPTKSSQAYTESNDRVTEPSSPIADQEEKGGALTTNSKETTPRKPLQSASAPIKSWSQIVVEKK